LEAGQAYLGRNTWPAIGIPGNLEAGQPHLGSQGSPGQLLEYLVTWRLGNPTWVARAAIGILGDL